MYIGTFPTTRITILGFNQFQGKFQHLNISWRATPYLTKHLVFFAMALKKIILNNPIVIIQHPGRYLIQRVVGLIVGNSFPIAFIELAITSLQVFSFSQMSRHTIKRRGCSGLAFGEHIPSMVMIWFLVGSFRMACIIPWFVGRKETLQNFVSDSRTKPIFFNFLRPIHVTTFVLAIWEAYPG